MLKLDIINEVVNRTGISKTKAAMAVEAVRQDHKLISSVVGNLPGPVEEVDHIQPLFRREANLFRVVVQIAHKHRQQFLQARIVASVKGMLDRLRDVIKGEIFHVAISKLRLRSMWSTVWLHGGSAQVKVAQLKGTAVVPGALLTGGEPRQRLARYNSNFFKWMAGSRGRMRRHPSPNHNLTTRLGRLGNNRCSLSKNLMCSICRSQPPVTAPRPPMDTCRPNCPREDVICEY